ncbi:MAG TPA: alpha/beta hydrolase [Gemmatimonadetes bacterium]|nr:alpha/beta hydrolase [Gemmatimonadota bacterium]
MRNGTFSALILAAFVVLPSGALAQIDDTQAWASHLSNQYRVLPNVTYLTASNRDNKVDLYLPRGTDGPAPVLVYIHGGGWVGGSKESSVLRLVPWMEMGWAVVNVQYRLGEVSLAPAAVEDCLCALRWIIRNAGNYNIDPERIVVTGNSAGGHLALTTGMVPASAGLDGQCPGSETLSVAAIINWYGITDVGDLLDGPNTKSYAVEWMGSMPNRFEIADRVSPLTYVRAGLPPILTIHGDADPTVPYQHGVQLHEELTKVGVSNQLHTVPGGRHGGFNRPETIAIFETIQEFLKSNGLLK